MGRKQKLDIKTTEEHLEDAIKKELKEQKEEAPKRRREKGKRWAPKGYKPGDRIGMTKEMQCSNCATMITVDEDTEAVQCGSCIAKEMMAEDQAAKKELEKNPPVKKKRKPRAKKVKK